MLVMGYNTELYNYLTAAVVILSSDLFVLNLEISSSCVVVIWMFVI